MKQTRYKYFVDEMQEGWVFRLLPNNNNNQPLAVSSIYSTEREAKLGLKRFQAYMFEGNFRNDVRVCEHEATDGKRCSYQVSFSQSEYVRSARLYQKKEINNGLLRLELNCEAPIKARK